MFKIFFLLVVIIIMIINCTSIDVVVISRDQYTNLNYSDRIRYSAALYESNLSNYYTLVANGNGLYKVRFKLLLMERNDGRISNKD